jgi:hypothetical protein
MTPAEEREAVAYVQRDALRMQDIQSKRAAAEAASDLKAFLRGDYCTYPRTWGPETPYYAYRVGDGAWAVRRVQSDGTTIPYGGSVSAIRAANMVDRLNGRAAESPTPEQGVLL